MTRGSIQEYTEAVRYRYLNVRTEEKGRILDEFIQVTGYHRKTASVYYTEKAGRGGSSGEDADDAMDMRW
jgi:hypothetical protein